MTKYFIYWKDYESEGTDTGFINKYREFDVFSSVKPNEDYFNKNCEFFDTKEEAQKIKDKLLDRCVPVLMSIKEIKLGD